MTDDAKANRVYGFVKGKTEYLYKDTAATKAMHAKLRRGVGKPLSAYPDAWGFVFDGLDEDLMSYKGTPSCAENAIWTALSLYALHQQGKQDQMSRGSNSFGAAVRELFSPDGSNEQAVRRRFNAVITAKDSLEVAYHARGLIQLFKSKDVPLDYPMFAKDLYWLQFPKSQSRVLLRWGEDSYRKHNSSDKQKKERTNEQ